MTNDSVTQQPIDIDVAAAKLILLRQEFQLPRQLRSEIKYSNRNLDHNCINIQLANPADLIAWADVLDIPRRNRNIHRYPDRSEIHAAYLDGWHGWYLNLVAYVEASEAAPGELDAETVAALEQVAA